MFRDAITVNPDPTIRRLSFKLRKMNMLHFNDELTIQEPGDGSLFWGKDFVIGYREALGDKISVAFILQNEDEVIAQMVKALTPWYLKIKEEEAKRSPRITHMKKDIYVFNGVVKTYNMGIPCDDRVCVCPTNKKVVEKQKEVSSNERAIKGDSSGQVPVPGLPGRNPLRD